MAQNGQLQRSVGGGAAHRQPELSADEEQRLAELENKLQLVRDRVGAVVEHYSTGLYVYGDGGVGKSHTVLEELDRQQADFIVFNSRMTGRGLFDALQHLPTSIHVLEDMEAVMRDGGAQGVLRSALWAQRAEGTSGPLQRTVTWTTAKEQLSFTFTGGVIVLANRPLADVPELQAIKTRITCLHLEVTTSELQAMMRSVALKGYTHDGKRMEPAECREVCDYVIEQSLAQRRSLNLRLLVNGFADYLQWQEGDAGCHWRDLVAARVREGPAGFQQAVALGSRAGRKAEEQTIVREILAVTKDRRKRNQLWGQRTGKSEAAFYRRLAEVHPPRASHSRKSEKVRK